MKNFLKIADGANVAPILNALQSKPDLWDENNLRTTHPLSPHRECNDVWVFFNVVPENVESVVDDTRVVPYRAWKEIPQLRPLIFDVMRLVEGTELGRVLITKLGAGKSIPPHIDQGAPVEYYTRYQIVLQSLPGCTFQIEEERVNFRAGEVWRIENSKTHSVVNNSADERLVVICDIRSA